MNPTRMTKLGLTAAVFIALTMMASPASALTTQWNQGVGIWQWNNPGNWNNGVPGSGDTASFTRISWAQPIGIDTNGALLNLGSGKLTGAYNGSVEVLYDSAFLTPNSNPLGTATNFSFGGYASLEAAAAASPMITVSEINFNKQHQLYVYHPVTVDNLIDRGSNYDFYGPVVVNTEVDLQGRGDTNDMVHFRSTLNAPTVKIGTDTELHAHGVATIGTLNIDHAEAVFAAYTPPTITTLNWNTGTYSVAADGAFPGADPLIVPAGGTLNIGAPQSLGNIPKITVPGFSLLAGDMTNMVYDSGHANYNCELQPDAIFLPQSGETNLPTQAELGGATLYAGIKTSNDNVTVGDDGTSIFKGAANGSWYGSYRANSTRIHAAAGSGDLQVVYFGTGCPQVGNNVRWYGDGTSTTADVSVINGARLDMQFTVNQDDDYTADPTLIRTFNITGETGYEARNILYFREGHPHIRAEQTYNVSKGKITGTGNLTGYMPGTLNLTDAILEQPGDDFAVGDGTLTLAGTTFIELSNQNNLDAYENLGARFVYPKVGDPDPGDLKAVFWGNKTYNINPAATPVLGEFLKNVDICRQGYQNTTFTSDLPLGHGKFLYNTYDRQNGGLVRPSTGAEEIVYAGNAPVGETPMIGFAALLNNTTIEMGVDATGAVVQIGTDDPNRLTHRLAPSYGGTNGFVSELPEHQVMFRPRSGATDNLTITADKMEVKSGALSFDRQSGLGTILNASQLDFDSVTPDADLSLRSYELDDAGPLAINVTQADEVKFWNLDGSGVHDLSNVSMLVGENVRRMNVDFGGGGAWRTLKLQDLILNTEMRIDDGAHVEITGTFGGTGTTSYRNYVLLAPGATVAPGSSVGELNTGGRQIQFSGDAIYEWELADPDGIPGEGWDLLGGSNLDFQGNLTLLLGDAGLTRDVTPDEEFLIAAAGSINRPPGWDVDPGDTGWTTTDAALRFEGGNLYISGILATAQQPGPDIIPEPATLSLLGLGALALLRRRRRR